MKQDKEQMLLNRGIVFIHMGMVALLAFSGSPRILLYSCLLWGVCSHLAIPLYEEDFHLILPPLWRYRHLFGLGVCYMISQSV